MRGGEVLSWILTLLLEVFWAVGLSVDRKYYIEDDEREVPTESWVAYTSYGFNLNYLQYMVEFGLVGVVDWS